MKDILLIGGPPNSKGVDRIDDDLVSILTAQGLYDRKAVVVWPTSEFLSVPADSRPLFSCVDMNVVEWAAIDAKGLMPSSGLTLERIDELREEVRKDARAIDDAVGHEAMSEAIYRLSRLVLDITGGLKVAVVVGNDAPEHSFCWTGLVDGWNSSSQVVVKHYDSKSPCYGALNAVKDWGVEFGSLNPGSHSAEDLLPIGPVDVLGYTINIDEDWYADVPYALEKTVHIEFPVENRAGNAKAVQVNGDDGFLLVVPEPDKPKNFRIGLNTGKAVPSSITAQEDHENAEVAPKAEKADERKGEWITVKEAAEILKCSTKTIRNYYNAGDLKRIKVNDRKVLILKSSVDKLLEG